MTAATTSPTAVSAPAEAAASPGRRRAVFHPLTVESVRPLTADAIEVGFAVPVELADAFDYRPGQHIALRMMLDGTEVRRSYSLCRAPAGGVGAPGTLSVAIKRERGGISRPATSSR
jgi:ring-1,2-phenylacetyl-CoA epoxidase subunit PaaE